MTRFAIAGALAALLLPIASIASPVTGAPSSTSGTISAATTVLPATTIGARLHLVVVNLAPSGGATLYCTDDGTTPSAANASFPVYAQGAYERDTPAWVPSAAIACVPSTGSVPYKAESYP